VTGGLGSGADAVLAAALERLIPADEHGPGAREAGVGRYLEGALARAGDDVRARWRAGLEVLDELARVREGAGFAALPPAAQHRILEAAADGPSPAFFEELRGRAIEGMFCDPAWGGNAGEAGWRLLGYPGPRHVWSAEDQRITDSAPRP
jgi:gluconate 2-dehydrogenase gamma chain